MALAHPHGAGRRAGRPSGLEAGDSSRHNRLLAPDDPGARYSAPEIVDLVRWTGAALEPQTKAISLHGAVIVRTRRERDWAAETNGGGCFLHAPGQLLHQTSYYSIVPSRGSHVLQDTLSETCLEVGISDLVGVAESAYQALPVLPRVPTA